MFVSTSLREGYTDHNTLSVLHSATRSALQKLEPLGPAKGHERPAGGWTAPVGVGLGGQSSVERGEPHRGTTLLMVTHTHTCSVKILLVGLPAFFYHGISFCTGGAGH